MIHDRILGESAVKSFDQALACGSSSASAAHGASAIQPIRLGPIRTKHDVGHHRPLLNGQSSMY
jgi:hypothetical protein